MSTCNPLISAEAEVDFLHELRACGRNRRDLERVRRHVVLGMVLASWIKNSAPKVQPVSAAKIKLSRERASQLAMRMLRGQHTCRTDVLNSGVELVACMAALSVLGKTLADQIETLVSLEREEGMRTKQSAHRSGKYAEYVEKHQSFEGVANLLDDVLKQGLTREVLATAIPKCLDDPPFVMMARDRDEARRAEKAAELNEEDDWLLL